jgi:IS1 family transposase
LLNKIKENNEIDIIATDKHWSYNKVIDCRKRRIKKTKFDRKTKKIVSKQIIEKEYKIKNIEEEKYLDCNLHIMDKSETCLVEGYNSLLRDRFAIFRRRTKACARDIVTVYNTVLIWLNRLFLINNIRNIVKCYYA